MASSPRVVLHVGTPKSGTTFLQTALWTHRRELRRQHVHLAGRRSRDMFLAAVEVREAFDFWGQPQESIGGTWATLCQQALRRAGTTVMSHELLAACSPEQAARALQHLDGAEVHVVLTARDLVRQVTSDWQERVKNGNTLAFARFRRSVMRPIRRGTFHSQFWRNQDPVGILDRWAVHLPAEQVHVVVAPAGGAPPQELWHRFAAAVGFDPTGLDPVGERGANATLGPAQITALRHVNKALTAKILPPAYERVVKADFAERILAAQSDERPTCPRKLAGMLREVAVDRNETLTARGYRIHGDLAELVPPENAGGRSPDKVPEKRVIEALAGSLAEVLLERAERKP